MRKLIFCLCCLLWAIPACAGDLELDLECLQAAYPGFITGTETDERGACVAPHQERRTSPL